ncbi:MAG: hypothetical protein HY925_06735, partial [Elusimicrobia bacterium]|nr:hypothetical protein [Elusimicrobiota bacterium]
MKRNARKTNSGRLPEGVVPVRYDLSIRIDPDAGKFDGRVVIAVKVERPVSQIVLHSLELALSSASVGGASVETTLDPEAETATLTLSSKLKPGKTTIELSFAGELNKQMRGLYLSTAKHRGKSERYAFTHFEPTSARRMLPHFDEPALKAVFGVTVTAPAHLTVLSNQPAKKRSASGGWQTVSFGDSPVMSSYLLAIAVARLVGKTRKVDGTPVSVWTR